MQTAAAVGRVASLGGAIVLAIIAFVPLPTSAQLVFGPLQLSFGPQDVATVSAPQTISITASFTRPALR